MLSSQYLYIYLKVLRLHKHLLYYILELPKVKLFYKYFLSVYYV